MVLGTTSDNMAQKLLFHVEFWHFSFFMLTTISYQLLTLFASSVEYSFLFFCSLDLFARIPIYAKLVQDVFLLAAVQAMNAMIAVTNRESGVT